MDLDIWAIVVNAVVVWFIFKLGQWSILIQIRMALRDALQRRGIDLDTLLRQLNEEAGRDAPDAKMLERKLNIEKVQGQYYAYAGDGDFLAQGRDFDELFQAIKQRFPDSNWRIDRDIPGLSTDEMGAMTKTIFRVFGDKDDSKH